MSPTTIPTELPQDLSVCHEMIRQLLEDFQRSQREIEQLEHRLQQLLKARYGPRAEKVDPAQLLLFAQEMLEQIKSETPAPPAPEPTAAAPARPTPHGRRSLPQGLPRKRVPVRICPAVRDPRMAFYRAAAKSALAAFRGVWITKGALKNNLDNFLPSYIGTDR